MSKETQANPEASTETVSALRQAIAKVEGLKDGLKAMLTDLNDVLKVLNVAQKEQRASEREVEEVRAALEAVKKLRL
jgi:ABC-type transporter Mla subunit MlaD